MIVDSHCHVSRYWYEPVEVLEAQMERVGIAQAVLTQMLGCYDNEYLFTCRDRLPDRFAVVVGIQESQPDAIERLDACVKRGAVGLRLRPTSRSPGNDPLAIWRTAEALGIAVTCPGNSAAFLAPEFIALLEEVPRLRVVLEHLGGTSQPDADPKAREIRTRVVQELARFPNVYLKVPGLGEVAPRRPVVQPGASGALQLDGVAELLEAARRSFGAERMMWGSDFPLVASREGYRNALEWTRELLSGASRSDQELIFGGTALRVFTPSHA